MLVMRGFEFRLSLSQLEFLSADCRLPSFDLAPLSRNVSFISFFSSDRIKLFFFLVGGGLLRRSRRGRKIHLIIFIFRQISSTFPYVLILSAETPFFPF